MRVPLRLPVRSLLVAVAVSGCQSAVPAERRWGVGESLGVRASIRRWPGSEWLTAPAARRGSTPRPSSCWLAAEIAGSDDPGDLVLPGPARGRPGRATADTCAQLRPHPQPGPSNAAGGDAVTDPPGTV